MGGRAALLCLVLAATADAGPLELGQEAPAFEGPVENPERAGQASVSLARWLTPGGKRRAEARAVLVAFAASWCKPCRVELPMLERLLGRHRGAGLRVVVIGVDRESPGKLKLLKLVEEVSPTLPLVFDVEARATLAWLGERAVVPTVVLVGAGGRVRAVHRGFAEDGEAGLEAEVKAALEERR